MKIYSKGSLYAADPKSTMVLYILQEGYCNARCRHCYMRLQKQVPQFRKSDIAKKDLESLTSQGYKVHLRGTEILLNPEYINLFPLIRQKYLQTNGKVLHNNPSLFEKVKNNGIEKIILTYPSNPENLIDFSEEMVNNIIKMVSKNGLKMVVDFIVTSNIVDLYKKDKEYFDRLCSKLMDLGADELRFVRLIPFSKELKEISPSQKDTVEIIEESVRLEVKYKEKINVTRAGQIGLYNLRRDLKEKYLGIKVPQPEQSGIMDCPGGKKLFVIGLNNKVYPCLYLMNQNHEIGNFQNGKIVFKDNAIIPAKLHIEDCPAYTENYFKY